MMRAASAALSAVLIVSAASAATAKSLKSPTAIPFVDDTPKPTPAKPAEAAPRKPAAAGVPLLPGSGSKEPVNITADKLDFLNKENKLVYTGNVVVVQGDSTLKASKLDIDLQRDAGGATAPATPAPADAGAPGQGSSVRHMEASGPVTLISKDQVGTGDAASYDKGENKVYLNGSVTLSQGANVTQGEHLVYNMTTGQAQVTGGRVSSVFTPGSGAPGGAPKASVPKTVPAPAKGHTVQRRGEDAAARDAEASR